MKNEVEGDFYFLAPSALRIALEFTARRNSRTMGILPKIASMQWKIKLKHEVVRVSS